MNCWKSININKEFGLQRMNFISFLVSILAFTVLYVPVSIVHGRMPNNEAAFVPFLIVLFFLPMIHTLMHILPLIVMNKRVNFVYKKKYKCIPVISYSTKYHLTKKVSFITAGAPSLLLTVPGIAASYMFPEYYFYFLVLASIHIGMSFIDYLYMVYIWKAPKCAFIDNRHDGFDILLKAQ
ncbi:DUF3267 domain-containing protein [Virgibacillus xinjiangensis]|uniref:DUF3267 domain-containing protein n=1 Tax=Virgibacillus xinjiangensis TaxID=393090 RepID=A0ABV7CW63_9BACI